MKKLLVCTILAATALLPIAADAHGFDHGWGHHGGPIGLLLAPIAAVAAVATVATIATANTVSALAPADYGPPAPAYAAPSAYYAQPYPQPVAQPYYAPAPVVYAAPAPVYYGPTVVYRGYYGPHYYHGYYR